jgi:methionyl aminopeptidase
MDAMAAAGKVAALALKSLSDAAKPGVSLLELEALALEVLATNGAKPSLLNYHPGFSLTAYQFGTCLSVNDEVIHGTPRKKLLREGDVLGIDLVANIDGWHADTAITVGVGEVSNRALKLMRITEESMWHGIEQSRSGNTMGDIGYAIQRHVEKNGFSILKNMVGHGVGTAVHEPGLDVLNTGRPKSGIRLEVGMTFCVEPMVTAGRGDMKHRKDDPWAVVTKDGSLGAHFEHTVGVTEDGPRVLTLLPAS